VAGDEQPVPGLHVRPLETRDAEAVASWRVQGWNERSLRLARGLGFRDAGTHQCVQDGKPVTYVLLVRPAEAGRP